FQAEDGIRDGHVTGVQTCALPIFLRGGEWCERDHGQVPQYGPRAVDGNRNRPRGLRSSSQPAHLLAVSAVPARAWLVEARGVARGIRRQRGDGYRGVATALN